MKYDSHICVDFVTAKAVIAYLYKYAYKRADTITARITYGKDEIEAYRSVRYISSSEAMWHMFGSIPMRDFRLSTLSTCTTRANNQLYTMKPTNQNNVKPPQTTPFPIL